VNVIHQIVLAKTTGWCDPVTEIISATPAESLRTRSYYDRNPLKTARDDSVVLLGDSCHPMSPFRGQGANIAMMDALDLADCLKLHQTRTLSACLEDYENKILNRSKPHVLTSRKAANSYHTESFLGRGFRNLSFQFLNQLIAMAKKKQSPKKVSS
jgi:salicylate hydroxylase